VAITRAASAAARAASSPRRPQARDGLIELLGRGGLLVGEAGDAPVRRVGQLQPGLGGLEPRVGGLDGRVGGGGPGLGPRPVGVEVAAVEHDERLARPHPVARPYADLTHLGDDARDDGGGRAGVDGAARLEGPVQIGCGHLRDGDVDRRALGNGGRRLVAAGDDKPCERRDSCGAN
jgi:hypothetical protein